MKKYTVSRLAGQQIDAIWIHVARDNINAADRLIDKFEDAFQLLGQNPLLGRSRPELGAPPAMFWPVGDYLVIYRQTTRGVQITGVIHGARDVRAILRAIYR